MQEYKVWPEEIREKKARTVVILGKQNVVVRMEKPVILPKDMETVEQHCEDLPDDMEPYTDSEGNVYNVGHGLSWKK